MKQPTQNIPTSGLHSQQRTTRRIHQRTAWLSIAALGCCAFAILATPELSFESLVNGTSPASSSAYAQADVPAASRCDDSGQMSILRMLFGGNLFGVVIVGLIIALSIVTAYFIFDHFMTITHQRLMPDGVLEEIEALIAHGEVNKAIDLCAQPDNYSMSTEIILAGLNRYKSSEFGFAEYRSAVEEAGEDQTGKLYRRTEVLNVIGAIAPMLGLTGTVLGMIEAFTTIARLEGMARPQELAGGIGQALITTLLGLVVAIPAMVAFSFFRNKIDSLVAEAGKRIERVMMPLGRKRNTEIIKNKNT